MEAATHEALTFDVLDDLVLAHERGRKIPVRLRPGSCLGSTVELTTTRRRTAHR